MTIKSIPRFLGMVMACPIFAVALLLISVPVFADWIPSDGHKMHWPQLPDEQGWDVNATNPVILADDWLCTGSGPVTDIHFWGSWRDMDRDGIGDVGQIVSFTLSIHSDIPANPPNVPYSRPGETLWEVTVEAWAAVPIDPPTLEAWLDPSQEPDFVVPNDHDAYFQYNVDLVGMGIQTFEQVEGTIYWLNISATLAAGQNAQWGWKSTIDHWNDDAVWATWGDLSWIDIVEPPRYNEFNVWLDPAGTFIAGGGTNYYTDGTDQQGWYHYEETGWWNIWFYDNPYTKENFKQATIIGQILPLEATAPSQVVIAVNWSTDVWSEGTTGRPPLPGDPNEDQNIGRQIIYTWEQGDLPPTGVPIEEFWELAEYNPEWISIDVQGFNFVFAGNIVHECVTTSLDLAFVINGPSDPTGACCWPDGSCTVETQDDCLNGAAAPGTYLGDGVPCLGDVNPQNGIDDACEAPAATGACCWPDGSCTIETKADCETNPAVPGTYLGDGTACLGDNNNDGIDDACGGAVVRGACCLQDGSCILVQQAFCTTVGGTYLGDNTACLGDADGNGVDDACETPSLKGACCWQDGTCSVVTLAKCVQNGGTYLGDNTACLGDGDGNGVDDACEKPDPDFKWEQLPDLDTTGFDVDASSPSGTDQPYVLADDFECTVTGPITRIHVYGSWFNDILPPGGPTDVNFILSLHEDIAADPGDPDSYSRPGELLCLLTDLQFKVKPYATDLEEGFLLPPDNLHIVGDRICWEYIFYLPPDICFQQGTPTNPVIYWLDVQAYPTSHPPPGLLPIFGWKSSLQHWNDDATWAWGEDVAGATPDWQELIYPANHLFAGESVDLAFKIIGSDGPTPTGACCWPDGTCSIETQSNCENGPTGTIGTYQGDGTSCLGDNNNNGIDDVCESILPTGACCYTDPASGPTCVNTTNSNCVKNLGGTWYPGQDCNSPNFSCPNQPPQGACCYEDAAGNMNCINTTQGQCIKLYGGTWYLGKDCATWTCPTPQPLGACCYGNPANPSCVNTTQDQCKSVYNGTWYLGQNCANFDCPKVVPAGACCFDDPATGPTCVNTDQSTCLQVYGGTWYAGQNCANIDCPSEPPTGACCYGDPASPSCINTTHADCIANYGGTWYLGQDCTNFECPTPEPLGACCYGDPANPACIDGVSQSICEAQFGGNWYSGQTCASIDCPTAVPLGACCFDDPVAGPSCVSTSKDKCLTSYGGTWYAGQSCADIDCDNNQPPQGACCYVDATGVMNCLQTTHGDCIANYGGTWYLGQTCADVDCPTPHNLGACCYGDPANLSCIDGVTQLICEAQFGGNWYAGQTCATIDCPTVVPSGACCYDIPGAGSGCVTTTQGDCLQTYGGTWYPGQDCTTVDCDNNQPPQGACCYVDATGVMNCLQTTHSDCIANYGGTWYLGQNCSDIDCPTPPDLGACCYGDPANPSCIDGVTQLICEAQFGGSWYAGQTCTSIDCPSVLEPTGACCYDVAGAGQACVNTTQSDCISNYGGTWYAGQDCASFDCPSQPPTGACCYGDPASPSCINTTEAECLSAFGGTWYANTDCTNFECPIPHETGACCYEDAAGNESCVNSTQLECKAIYGGTWYANTDCDTFTCPDPEPMGACCYGTPQLCVNTTEDQCKSAYGGTWYAGEDCATFTCPSTGPTGACCWPDGSCTIETKNSCIGAAAPGTYLGDGSVCIGDLDGNGVDDVCEVGEHHKMHFPQFPDEAGWDVNATEPVVLADDFMCSETGWIKDIHFWGSWKDDLKGEILAFKLSFHSDIPVDTPQVSYSRPGELLWERDIDRFVSVPLEPPTLEGWYDPATGEVLPDNHKAYYKYDIYLDTLDWFFQDSGTIYWLNISAVLAPGSDQSVRWGWKSSFRHWNDDAVWSADGADWTDLWEPGVDSQSLDLAFVITGDPCKVPKWKYHYKGLGEPYDTCNTGLLTVWGTVDCDTTGHPALFSDTAWRCQTYSDTIPSWANDILFHFKWHCWCGNNDWAKLAAPIHAGGQWQLQNLSGWYNSWYGCGDNELTLVALGDPTGTIQNVYYVVDLNRAAVSPVFSRLPQQDEYQIANGFSDDLPGYFFSTTPITFNPDAPPPGSAARLLNDGGPFEGTPLNGTLYWDGEVSVSPGTCCVGITGNIDGDPQEIIDLGDLTALIDYLFITFTVPDCFAEANVDGDPTGMVDLGDLTALIDYLFITFTPPAPCQ